MLNNKYQFLIVLSIISSLILIGINYLVRAYFAGGGEAGGFLYLFIVMPLTPLMSLPATLIVFFIHRWFHKDTFFLTRMGIPFLFNLLGASVILLSYLLPAVNNRVQHPPAGLKLTGIHSDEIGSRGDEKTLDVSITLYSSRAGEFSLGMQLMAGDQVISTSSDLVTLAPGENVVTYQFHGDDIRLYQLDGPYQINVLPVMDDDTMDIIELENNQWQTAAYHWRDFGDELCHFLTVHVYPIPSAGTMEFSPAPNCADGGYLHGTSVTVKAIPNSGYQFVGWRVETPRINSDSSVFTRELIRDMEAEAFFELQP